MEYKLFSQDKYSLFSSISVNDRVIGVQIRMPVFRLGFGQHQIFWTFDEKRNNYSVTLFLLSIYYAFFKIFSKLNFLHLSLR